MRQVGITDTTFYKWRSKCAGLKVSEALRLRQLEEETMRLKGFVADETLDIQVLKEVLGRTRLGRGSGYISIKDEVNADGERVHESKPINPGASIYSETLCNHDTVSIAFMLHKIVFDMPDILHFEQKKRLL